MAAYTGTPRTWVAGETVTAALMNSDVRDPLAALAGAWTSYTPTLAQGASTDIAKTVNHAKYVRVGKLVIMQAVISATAAGTSGSAVTLSLPVAASTSVGAALRVGGGYFNDAGTAYYTVAVGLPNVNTLAMYRADAPWTDALGADPSLAVASGDNFGVYVTYEAA